MKFSKLLKDIRLQENISVNNLSKLSEYQMLILVNLRTIKENSPPLGHYSCY